MALPRTNPVPINAADAQAMLVSANRALDAARDVTLHYFRQTVDVHNKAGGEAFDPVTIADREAELAIRDVLARDFPDIGFYGEEHAPEYGDSGLLWVVDPIDGTRAFVSGMPMWGTLIGLFDGQKVVMGLLDQAVLDERYIGFNQQATMVCRGATQTLTTRTTTTHLNEATFYCTTPDMFKDEKSASRFRKLRDAVKLVRYGGDCYAYALLALGFVDVVLDTDLKPYDIAALMPIIEAAGGVVTDWNGGDAVDGGQVVATVSKHLHKQVLEILASG